MPASPCTPTSPPDVLHGGVDGALGFDQADPLQLVVVKVGPSCPRWLAAAFIDCLLTACRRHGCPLPAADVARSMAHAARAGGFPAARRA